MAATEVFSHSTPELYDRLMGPLLFNPWAQFIADRAALFEPGRILETAAGTGIVTEALHRVMPTARIVATDINPGMLGYASNRFASDRVTFKQANAENLPFDDEFDLVVCQFGVMFFPDKRQANREARRVLRPGAHYMLLTFDRLDRNPIPQAAGKAVASLFAEDPHYMERGPFSYSDTATIEQDLRLAGFANVQIETIALSSRVDATDASRGIVLGSPFRSEIERLDPSAVQRALDAVEQSLAPWHGKLAPMSAHLAIASA
jgi:ubiquinone/menaquinone biosynthesis C-methylase UbiE